MILEIATLSIKTGSNMEFESAFEQAKKVVISSPGCLSAKLMHCIENESKYQVLIEWETLEAHTVTFRESEKFTQWRTLIGPYFESAPQVEHFEMNSAT